MFAIKKSISRLGLAASVSAALFATTVQAQSCDSCTNTIIENTAATADNTAGIEAYMEELVGNMTTAMFSSAPAVGSNMPAFVAIHKAQTNAYGDQLTQLKTMEENFQGSSDEDQTLITNYQNVFGDYLLQNEKSISEFSADNVSVASLYTDPSTPSYYRNDDEVSAAQKYIQIVSGSASSSWQKPGSWLEINDDSADKDEKKIRKYVSNYYTYMAIQSAIADNFAYIYSLNTGYSIDGSLSNYDDSSISEMGLVDYLLNQIESEEWYSDVAALSISSAMKVATVLLGGCFLELVRIEHVLDRLLITQSAQSTLDLVNGAIVSESMSSAENAMPS
jgi:hypothetical protein